MSLDNPPVGVFFDKSEGLYVALLPTKRGTYLDCGLTGVQLRIQSGGAWSIEETDIKNAVFEHPLELLKNGD